VKDLGWNSHNEAKDQVHITHTQWVLLPKFLRARNKECGYKNDELEGVEL
jgi:hypothetical protein